MINWIKFLEKQTKEKGISIIVHRLQTVKEAYDLILFENGKIQLCKNTVFIYNINIVF